MSAFDRISCVTGDITVESVDAIVNAANSTLRGGGGVDGAIHRAAGPGLLQECVQRHPEGCPTGQARITGGHELAAKHVIHTVGPVWAGGEQQEPELLASCCRAVLELAARNSLRSIALPAISTGVYGYPHAAAAQTTIATLGAELVAHPIIEQVRLVLFTEQLQAVFAAELLRQRASTGA